MVIMQIAGDSKGRAQVSPKRTIFRGSEGGGDGLSREASISSQKEEV
jgi:hypothetical protein